MRRPRRQKALREPAAPARYLRRRFRAAEECLEHLEAELWVDHPLGIEIREGALDVYYSLGEAPPLPAAPAGVELLAEDVIGEDDWLAGWRAATAPFALGERFWVDPGEPRVARAPEGRRLLRLPARRAFGTGSHASSRLAVAWLEEVPLHGLDVLDVGAGSGLLSFVCRSLGARRVVAIERELESVLLAGENRRLNRLEVGLVGGDGAALGAVTFDVIVANLLSAHLAPELERLTERLRPGGTFVYSGALTVERRALQGRFRALDLVPLGEKIDGEWSAWRLRSERGA